MEITWKQNERGPDSFRWWAEIDGKIHAVTIVPQRTDFHWHREMSDWSESEKGSKHEMELWLEYRELNGTSWNPKYSFDDAAWYSSHMRVCPPKFMIEELNQRLKELGINMTIPVNPAEGEKNESVRTNGF